MNRKFTEEKISNINKKCSNGFELNERDYRLMGEVQLTKDIRLPGIEAHKAVLCFRKEKRKGQFCNIPTGKVIPVCKLLQSDTSEFIIKTYEDMKVGRPRVEILQSISRELDDKKIESLFRNKGVFCEI